MTAIKKITASKPAKAGRPSQAVNDRARIKSSSPDKTDARAYDGPESYKMKMKNAGSKSITDLVFTSPNAGMGKASKKKAPGLG